LLSSLGRGSCLHILKTTVLHYNSERAN
jgi:hypothetical protein